MLLVSRRSVTSPLAAARRALGGSRVLSTTAPREETHAPHPPPPGHGPGARHRAHRIAARGPDRLRPRLTRRRAAGSPPETVDDVVRIYAGAGREVDPVANDTDPDGDDLALCRLGRVPRNLFVSTVRGRAVRLHPAGRRGSHVHVHLLRLRLRDPGAGHRHRQGARDAEDPGDQVRGPRHPAGQEPGADRHPVPLRQLPQRLARRTGRGAQARHAATCGSTGTGSTGSPPTGAAASSTGARCARSGCPAASRPRHPPRSGPRALDAWQDAVSG